MPFTPLYDPSALSTADIGYTSGPVAFSIPNGQFGNDPIPTTIADYNQCNINLPPGVWLVEGQINTDISNPALYYFWSLSTTKTFDATTNKRINLVWLNNVGGASVPNHMSSIFSTTAANTPVYIVARIPNGTSKAVTFYMTYTRIG
jgi:hypothetical protein